MIANLIKELNELYIKGGISNINFRTLIGNNIYNDVITCLDSEPIRYEILEYCSILINKHDEYIINISVCND